MANHKSAKKCIRKTARRTEINRARVTRFRTFVKKAEVSLGMHNQVAISAQDAMAAVVQAESEMMSAVSKGVLHKKTAARKISRLVKRAKALSA
ncbi:MAG: 30S ribosomal protein S20 [Holosporales bacterium]